MKYEDLITAHSEKVFGYDTAYEILLSIKNSFENLNLIIDFLRRWNKRVPIERNKEKIKKAVIRLKNEFEFMKKYNFEDLEFNPTTESIILKIFNKLSETVLKSEDINRQITLGPTGTSKLMHGLNPNLFVMWDKGICMKYGVYPNSAGYINFMKLMQKEIKEVLSKHKKEAIIKETNRTLPKLIDEYNWINFKTSKMI